MTARPTTSMATLAGLHADAVAAAKFLKEATPLGVQITEKMRADLAAIEARWDLPPAQKSDGRRLTREAARERLAELNLATKRAVAAIDAYVERATAADHDDHDVAAEMRRTAAWNRVRGLLDATPKDAPKALKAMDLVEDAQRRGDRAALEALRRELPAYLGAHGEDVPSHLPAQLDMLAGPQVARDARTLEAEIAAGRQRTLVAVGSLHRSVDTSTDPVVVPGWSDGDVITIEPAAQA